MDLAEKRDQERKDAAAAVKEEQAGAREARETLAEVRGRLAIAQEQADFYWNKKTAKLEKKAGK